MPSGTFGVHCVEKILAVVGQAHFLLVDVEFFDVENHFLFKAVAVDVLKFDELLKVAFDALFYAVDARTLVLRHLRQQILNGVDTGGDIVGQSLALLLAESHKLVGSVLDCLENQRPIVLVEFVAIGFHCVGQAKDCREQFGTCHNAKFGG